MNRVSPLRPEELFRTLLRHDVEFIVVGGFAVAAHGRVRATKDIDICPSPEDENLKRLVDALDELDAEVIGLEEFEGEHDLVPDVEGLSQGGNWHFNTRLGRLDVIQFASSDPDVGYEALEPRVEPRSLYGLELHFCGYEDLLRMKAAAGREQDLIDINDLKAARGEQPDHRS